VTRRGDGPEGEYQVRVARSANHALVLEARDITSFTRMERDHDELLESIGERRERELAERNRENEALRDLARAMAAVSDSAELLKTLCDAAIEQCDASGAAVAQVTGGEAKFVGAGGLGIPLRGVGFPLSGSLTEEVLRSDTLNLSTYRSRAPHMRPVARVIGSGPIVLTPLRAHGVVLGVLYLWRTSGAPQFSERDVARVRVIADHSSLALHKARLIEEAQSANEAKNNFLASVSHELRTPITALTGYGELLADGILGEISKPQQDVIERMRAVTHHLSALIDEILTYTSLEAGREIVRMREIACSELLGDTAAVIEPLARQKGIRFEAAPPASALRVVTDPDKARQILVNLAGNAVKFTDRGSVRLTVEGVGDTIRFSVQDTGIGIAECDRPRLFHPFSQLDGGLTRRHGGTGLGLYISRRLAQLVNGEIELESAPGKGSTFTLVVGA
jgi:signal transduction histidine kinase